MKEHLRSPFTPQSHQAMGHASHIPIPSSNSLSNCGAMSEVSYCYSWLLGYTLPQPNEGTTQWATWHFPHSQSRVVPISQRLALSRWQQEVTLRCPHLRAPVTASPAGLVPHEGAGLWAWWCTDGGICSSRAGSLGTFTRLSKWGNFCPSRLLWECQD